MQSHGETIMLVDDEESLLELGQEILGHFGYKTIKSKNGEKALEIYSQDKNLIDLIILDLSMPGMGGYNCLKKLLKIDPKVKVIISSGYSSTGEMKKMLEAGAAEFIEKPYHLMELAKKVRQVLDERKSSHFAA
jgi:DNA-binding NtrC family response regulator